MLELLAHYSISLPLTEWCHQGNQLTVGCQQPALGPVRLGYSAAVELSWYLVSSFPHELLGRHLPNGRNCDHPSHIVVVKLPACLVAQLLREGVYFRNMTQTIQVLTSIYSHADVWDEKRQFGDPRSRSADRQSRSPWVLAP